MERVSLQVGGDQWSPSRASVEVSRLRGSAAGDTTTPLSDEGAVDSSSLKRAKALGSVQKLVEDAAEVHKHVKENVRCKCTLECIEHDCIIGCEIIVCLACTFLAVVVVVFLIVGQSNADALFNGAIGDQSYCAPSCYVQSSTSTTVTKGKYAGQNVTATTCDQACNSLAQGTDLTGCITVGLGNAWYQTFFGLLPPDLSGYRHAIPLENKYNVPNFEKVFAPCAAPSATPYPVLC